MAKELFSKENLLKYTPTNVVKLCFSVAFISFCLVCVIMMSKSADIPIGKVLNAYADSIIRSIEGTVNHEHPDMLEDIEQLKINSHAPRSEDEVSDN